MLNESVQVAKTYVLFNQEPIVGVVIVVVPDGQVSFERQA